MQGPKRAHLGHDREGQQLGTPDEGLRGQREISSPCWGLRTATAGSLCTERAPESGPAPAPFGKSHDANSYQVRPEEGMSRAASHDNHCPLSVPAEKQAFEVNSHLLWGLIARMPVFHEGHFINHSKSKPVREERKRKDALEKHRHLPVP